MFYGQYVIPPCLFLVLFEEILFDALNTNVDEKRSLKKNALKNAFFVCTYFYKMKFHSY